MVLEADNETVDCILVVHRSNEVFDAEMDEAFDCKVDRSFEKFQSNFFFSDLAAVDEF